MLTFFFREVRMKKEKQPLEREKFKTVEYYLK